jgi:hypothetical protein
MVSIARIPSNLMIIFSPVHQQGTSSSKKMAFDRGVSLNKGRGGITPACNSGPVSKNNDGCSEECANKKQWVHASSLKHREIYQNIPTLPTDIQISPSHPTPHHASLLTTT